MKLVHSFSLSKAAAWKLKRAGNINELTCDEKIVGRKGEKERK